MCECYCRVCGSIFIYLSLNCLFYILHPLLFFVRFKFNCPFYFLLPFYMFSFYFVFCDLYCFSLCILLLFFFLCKSVRTLPQGGNSIAVMKYRIISYPILSYVLVLMYHLQVEQHTSFLKAKCYAKLRKAFGISFSLKMVHEYRNI